MEIVEEKEKKNNEKIEEENIELDLTKYGQIDIESGGTKPIFDKITKGVVKSAVLMTSKERREEKNKEGKTMVYYPVYLKCQFDVDGKEVYENYGGGKLFVSDTKEETKFWLGDNSALGKLKQIIADNKDFNGTLQEIPKLLIGEQIGLKTEYLTVAGTEYVKNTIKQFY